MESDQGSSRAGCARTITRRATPQVLRACRGLPGPTDPPDLATEEVWSYSPPGRCLVLGSSQRDEIADLAAAERAGVQVATRRSGGGAVYVDPARCVWVDVVLPPHDRRWSDDVRAATTWLGEAWQRALATIGLDARLHRGQGVRRGTAHLPRGQQLAVRR